MDNANLSGAIYRDSETPLPEDIEDALRQHSVWIASNGAVGQRADFKGRNLDGLNFSSCDVRGGFLRRLLSSERSVCPLELFLTSFNGADLARRDMSFSRVHGTGFREANLTEVLLIGAKIAEAKIIGADGKATGKCISTRFAESNLIGCNLSGAEFDGADFTGAAFDPKALDRAIVKRVAGVENVRAA